MADDFSAAIKDAALRLPPQELGAALEDCPEQAGLVVEQITRKRADLKKESGLPQFIDGIYEEAESYAKKALKSLRSGEARKAKALYYAANVYHERAERDAKDMREFGKKIAGLLKT